MVFCEDAFDAQIGRDLLMSGLRLRCVVEVECRCSGSMCEVMIQLGHVPGKDGAEAVDKNELTACKECCSIEGTVGGYQDQFEGW